MDPPLRVTPYVWESHPGRLSITIACELAFRLVHGAEAQPVEPVRFYDEDLAATAQADVHAPYKPRADVLVVGHAFSPVSGPEVERLLVRVRVGDYSKAVRVTGDRLWTRGARGLTPGPPRPFRRMLLSAERAARTAENPRGMDPEAVRMEHRLAMPNLEPAAPGQEAFLGPVPVSAPRRVSLLHPIGAAWARALFGGQHAGPPPDHFAFAYFNLAPADQQLGEIAFGSALALEGLHPEHAIVSSRLPPARIRAYVYDGERRGHVEVDMRIDTLWIDADREVASIVVRGVAPVSHPDAAKHVTVRVERFHRTHPPQALSVDTQAMATQVAPDLPFSKAAQPTGTRSEPPPLGDTARLSKLEIEEGVPREPAPRRSITQEIVLDAATAATPFEAKVEEDTTQSLGRPRTETAPPPPGSRPPPAPPAPLGAAPVAGTIGHDESTADPTPSPRDAGFLDTPDLESTSSGDPTTVIAKSGPVATSDGVRLVPPNIPATPPPPLPERPAHLAPPPVAPDPPKPALVNKLLTATETRLGMVQLGATKLSAPPPPRIDEAAPRPPATPARVETRGRHLSEESTDTQQVALLRGVEARTLEEAEADADRDAFEFPLPPSDGFEVDGVTLEHCAAVRAELSMPGAARADVLSKNDLDDAAWTRIEKAHLARIDQETSRGVSDLLSRYDASYVAAQDKLRRPIGVKEYARIVVARDGGTLAEALAELSLPRSELMRLDRVWKQRRLAYPEVDRAVAAAVAASKTGAA